MKALMWVKFGCAGLLLAALAGCGGGGGGSNGGGNSDPPPPPPPTSTFTVSGTLSGAVGELVLQNNGAGNLTVGADGTFTFIEPLNSGAAYSVTVLTAPALQACNVTNGDGTLSANVTNVTITCADVPPTLALTLQKTKTFRFTWSSVAGGTHYRLLESPNGMAGFTQLDTDITAPVTTVDKVVTLHQRFGARYILQACGATRCIDSNTVNVTGSLAEAVGYFKASNPHLAAAFGLSLALSADGTTLAVGAPGERSAATHIDGDQSDAGIAGAGAVYVFTRTGAAWAQQAYVKATNTPPAGTPAGDRFGISVALSADGSILAVGADEEDSRSIPSEESEPDSGAVYVYKRDGQTWRADAYVKASNVERFDGFGRSVALSADGFTLVVAAPGEDSNARGINQDAANNLAGASGAVYVFTQSATAWSQQAYVKASNTGAADNFGVSLALSADGNTLAVGAHFEDGNARDIIGGPDADPLGTLNNSGAVYVFGREGVAWSQQAYVKASNTNRDDQFGIAVALSGDGNTLAVGADGEDSSGTAAGEDDNDADQSGAVYIHARSGGVWTPRRAYLKASNTGAGDRFGSSVALSADGRTLVVGARNEASNARGFGGDGSDNSGTFVGAAYVFEDLGIRWIQHAYVKASNAAKTPNEFFGEVAISADASVLAVGAPGEDGISSGINGDESSVSATRPGAVYLY